MAETRRIHLSRARGWKLTDHVTGEYVIVDRRGGFGNPWGVYPTGRDWPTGRRWIVLLGEHFPVLGEFDTKPEAQGLAVDLFRRWLTDDAFAATLPEMGRGWILDSLGDLVGKTLCCWCPEGTPCHAEVLLGLARGGEAG